MDNLSKKQLTQSKFTRQVLSTVILGLALNNAHADYDNDPFQNSGFVKDDWHVVCDNTLTCRAAGYSDDSAEWRGSILMTLQAGEKTPSAQVLLNYWDSSEEVVAQIEARDDEAELWLNGKFYGNVSLSSAESDVRKLTEAQTTQLINHAKKNTKIVFKLGEYQWHISDKGMAAVLLKLDEVQGRVGTSLALVSKNAPSRQIPKRSKPIPKVYAAYTYPVSEYSTYEYAKEGTATEKPKEQKYYQHLSKQKLQNWQNNMTKWVIPTLDQEARADCNVLTSDNDWFDAARKIWRFIPIDNQHTLASHPCWTGAYNFGTGYWLMFNDSPSKPKLITTSGSDYAEGEIFSAHKGRGLGDCWSMTEWVWNGKIFAKTLEQTTGLCRLIEAGGAWSMPTYVSEVITSDKR